MRQIKSPAAGSGALSIIGRSPSRSAVHFSGTSIVLFPLEQSQINRTLKIKEFNFLAAAMPVDYITAHVCVFCQSGLGGVPAPVFPAAEDGTCAEFITHYEKSAIFPDPLPHRQRVLFCHPFHTEGTGNHEPDHD